jgi:hypothetical protein
LMHQMCILMIYISSVRLRPKNLEIRYVTCMTVKIPKKT